MAPRPVQSDPCNHIALSTPGDMNSEQRRAELASTLAAGIMRHFKQRRMEWPPAASLVVERCVVDLIRERKAMARDYRRAESLEELSEEVGDGNLRAWLAERL